jgi:hypothetical protein
LRVGGVHVETGVGAGWVATGAYEGEAREARGVRCSQGGWSTLINNALINNALVRCARGTRALMIARTPARTDNSRRPLTAVRRTASPSLAQRAAASAWWCRPWPWR